MEGYEISFVFTVYHEPSGTSKEVHGMGYKGIANDISDFVLEKSTAGVRLSDFRIYDGDAMEQPSDMRMNYLVTHILGQKTSLILGEVVDDE